MPRRCTEEVIRWEELVEKNSKYFYKGRYGGAQQQQAVSVMCILNLRYAPDYPFFSISQPRTQFSSKAFLEAEGLASAGLSGLGKNMRRNKNNNGNKAAGGGGATIFGALDEEEGAEGGGALPPPDPLHPWPGVLQVGMMRSKKRK